MTDKIVIWGGGIAFGLVCLAYYLVMVLRGASTGRQRLLAVLGIVIFSPLAMLLAISLWVLVWPLFFIGALFMVVSPLRLLTHSGRDDFARLLRRGRWRDRP